MAQLVSNLTQIMYVFAGRWGYRWTCPQFSGGLAEPCKMSRYGGMSQGSAKSVLSMVDVPDKLAVTKRSKLQRAAA